jgi:RHS repeat-associated protein
MVGPGQAKRIQHDEARLDINANAVDAEVTLNIASLGDDDTPLLDPGMTNVTKGPRKGYRFLPHGTKFKSYQLVRLPYDPSLLPPAYTEEDIKTYYFDEEAGYWKELVRVAVITETREIASCTDHFTDMINATVTVPDHPQPLSYNPTSIKDIEAADPGTGINLIEAPQANNMGDARLFYPIEVPPGRNGMQPQLGISYNSSGENGWLGLGWEMAIPAVTIDTRWGVPRYDAQSETETYLLNGEQLTPIAHRGEPQARTAEKIFHTRVEGGFEKIIRHGNHPADYWWEVIGKDGTRYFYGGDSTTNRQAADSTLANAEGAVFKWALREVRDLSGNGIKYSYDLVSDPGLEGGTVPGYQLYPRSINYTQFNGEPGAYTVTFVRDSQLPGYARRPDVMIDARGGFKVVTAELLKQIGVTFNGDLIRQYDLDYREGAFNKTLLNSITQRGENGAVFNTHEFSYYDDVREAGDYRGFDTQVVWETGSDNVTAGLLNYGQASALSGSINDNIGGHLYLGFNPTEPTKEFSAGGKVGFNHSNSETVLALIDINGDNLPDKVFRSDDGAIYFRLNQSGPNGTTVFSQSTTAIPSLPAIGEESATVASFGGEVYVVANVFVNHANTFTTGSVYFSDVNGDGLPDLVNNGQVLFNHLNADGVPIFGPDSNDTPVPISGGIVDTTDIISDYESIYQDLIDTFPLHDTLRRWVAPYNGRIQITGDVALIEDTDPARSEYRTADGVRVAIQHNASELWSISIPADDYSPKTPTDVNSIAVQKGDRIYFRGQSVFDGKYDQVHWDPEIVYLGTSAITDVNSFNPYRYRASEDFVLAGRPGIHVRVPLTGTLRLTGDLYKDGNTTDDVTLLVYKNDSLRFTESLTWNQTGSIVLNQDIDVLPQDSIKLRVRVDSPIDLSQLRWKPSLFYIATSDPNQRLVDEDGDYIFQLHPPYDIDMYPLNDLESPQQAWRVPEGPLVVLPQLRFRFSPFDEPLNGTVTFTVKRRGELVHKGTLVVVDNQMQPAQFTIDNVTSGDDLFFDFSVSDPRFLENLVSHSVIVNYGNAPSAFHSAAPPGLFGQPYRGWAYAGYNGNRDRAAQPIDEDDLEQEYTQDYPFDIDDPDAGQDFLRNAKAYFFYPFPDEDSWRGPDDLAWVKADQMSSSRLGMDFIAVPRPDDFAGGRAVSRLSRTSQTAIGAGVFFLSGSGSDGTSYDELDYLDMNGDLFPDIVGNGRVQYTTMEGGLEESNRVIPGLGRARDSDNSAWNFGIGGSPASFKANSKGEVDSSGKGSPKENKTGSQMVTLGLSAGLGAGESDMSYDLLDINGDGLPDRLSRQGGQLKVAFNLGYGFADTEPWGDAAINDGASENGTIGASLGFNGGIYDFAGGLSLDKNQSETEQTLLDINGDGLPDRIKPNADNLRVAFNTGNGFAPEVDWRGAPSGSGICRDDDISLPAREVLDKLGIEKIDWDHARICDGNTGLGGGVYFTIGIGPLCLAGCYIIINPGADYNHNMARQEAVLRDADGDGYVDHLASRSDGSMTAARNRTGRTNVLQSIQRPLGARIDLEYQRKGNTYDQPYSRWALSKVTLHDGHPGDGVDSQVTTYRYEDGFYNRLEREFYGYGKVVEEQRDASNGEALYRTIVREFLNDSYYTKGLLKHELVQDTAARPYVETEHTYVLRDVETGDEPADPQSTSASIFPELVRTDQRFYEGNLAPGKTTHTTYRYDGLGNVVEFFDAGDSGAQDDVMATIGYSACADTYVVGIPIAIVVTGDGTLMRRREADIDCAGGAITQVRQYLEGGDAAVTDLDYFPNGNLRQVTGPPNKNGQRYQINYEYDPLVQTHIARITDSFGYTSSASYNYKYGLVETTFDINNNRTSSTYDAFGRMASVTGPYEQGGDRPTIQFEYHPEAGVPWALTRHIDTFRSATDTIDTVLFIDGLKRILQTKKDVTIHTGAAGDAQDVMSVSGRVTFDFVGRTVELFYPVVEALGTPGTFNPTYDTVQPTRITYDVLDRTTRTTFPDDTSTTTAFGFGPDRSGVTRFETTVTDANGVQKTTYRDVKDLITSIKEFNGGGSQVIWTSYGYDPLGQITQVVDDHNNVTRVGYDNLGRRTVVDNPDTGRTTSVYDLASNVIAKITAVLRAEGEQINYDYEFTRPQRITYPDFPENDVSYEYGGPGASDNRAGRISVVTSEAGREERFYGKLGEITQEIKAIASDTGPRPEVYTTRYAYDTWGRLQTLTYPDGEVLTYRYDSGGLVHQASGEKAGFSYDYVKRLEYDKFEQRVFVEAGNGVRTRYSYDPRTRRLVNLKAGKGQGQGNLFQNLNYSYDNVGNVLGLTNDVPVSPPSQFGGPTSQTFTYDDLYRLTDASGSYRYAPNKTNRYSLTLAYDTIHNIVAKSQRDEIVQPSGKAIEQKKTTYEWAYSYGGPQPHAPTHIGDRAYRYDGNGNQLGWDADGSGQRRTIVWDEENRIQSIFDNGHEKAYKYDDAGERVIKRGPQGETVYVNPYYVVRNREIGTKHVYLGATRLVSKLVKQPKPGEGDGEEGDPNRGHGNDPDRHDEDNPGQGQGNGPGNGNGQGNGNGNGQNNGNGKNQGPEEKDLYFYHPDHLGSTNYVTDADGELYQHLEYFPFGETWVEEASNTQRVPYLFTAKELDEETGLYYFGARYYDPRTSVWQSPDPALGQYLEGNPNRGVFDSRNLGLFSYVGNNPVKLEDPDGLYKKNVHFDVTRLIFKAVGFSDKDATTIAAADAGVDVGATSPGYAVKRYYLGGKAGRAEAKHILEMWHFPVDQGGVTQENSPKALQRLRNAIKGGKLKEIGKQLHVYQDSWSHQGFQPWPGHAKEGFRPDQTFRPENWERDLRMLHATFNQAAGAARRMGVSGSAQYPDFRSWITNPEVQATIMGKNYFGIKQSDQARWQGAVGKYAPKGQNVGYLRRDYTYRYHD